MEVIIIDSEAYRQLKTELKEEVKKALKEILLTQSNSQISDWISQDEAKKLITYSSRTSWQKLRNSGEIIWSKDGRLILYSRKSIEQYIEKNRMV
jgi:hypothetical protein